MKEANRVGLGVHSVASWEANLVDYLEVHLVVHLVDNLEVELVANSEANSEGTLVVELEGQLVAN